MHAFGMFEQISVSLKNLWCSECMVCEHKIMFGQNYVWTELVNAWFWYVWTGFVKWVWTGLVW
jgi:hypothetical protein